MWVQKVVRSKFIKCFLIAIVLVFSFEASKPKALGPVVGWAAAVLVGMAAETLITMGVKAGSKAILERKAKSYAAEMARTGQFDFTGTNPYRNKDGSITLTPSANDRAKMAGLIAGTLAGTMFGTGTDSACPPPVTSGKTYFRITHDSYPDSPAAEAVFRQRISEIKQKFEVYGQTVNGVNSIIWDDLSVDSAPSSHQIAHEFNGLTYWVSQAYNGYTLVELRNSTGLVIHKINAVRGTVLEQQNAATFEAAKASLVRCDEVYVPSTIKRVYPAPMGMSSDFEMPNNAELSNKPITIYNVFPASEEEGEITWTELDDYYNNNGLDANTVVNGNVDRLLTGGQIITDAYKPEQINNYYTDINYPEKIEDFKPPVVVPGETLPGEPVSELDHSMWQVMKNTYNYLDDGIDSSLVAMKGITDSAQGITNYLNQTMGWLPMEFRAVLTSAFVLGVFAHFLRR